MDRTADDRRAWLIADIGATSSRCAILDFPQFNLHNFQIYANDDFASIDALLKQFLADCHRRPDNCALGVAAPVYCDDIAMVNRAWRFNRTELGAELGVRKIEIINDFHANAYALPSMDNQSRIRIGHDQEPQDANMAVLGPGSGLGMAAWIGRRDDGCVMSGEGGHVSVAGRNEAEDEIVARFRQQFAHCSAERILSGPGLVALHEIMHGISVSSSAQITSNTADPHCVATLQQFFLFLGSVAADLALVTGAFGGIYIAGGIVPACIDQLAASGFRDRFEDKNRYRHYMQRIPTFVITDPAPGLRGLRQIVMQQS